MHRFLPMRKDLIYSRNLQFTKPVGYVDQYAVADKNLAKGLNAKYWIGCSAGFLAGCIQSEFSAFDIKNDISMRYWIASEMCAERI